MKPAIYVINLERSVSRREFVSAQLHSQGLDFEIFDAVDGNRLAENETGNLYSDENARKRIGRSLSREEIGCCLSHINIYRDIVQKNLEYAIVFEDDIILEFNPENLFKSLFNNQDHWDIVFLNYANYCLYYWYRVNLYREYKLRKFVNVPWRSAAYVISGHSARQILKRCFPLFLPIDDFIHREMKEVLKIRCVYPMPVDHMPEDESASTMKERNSIKENLTSNISKQMQLAEFIKNNTSNLYRKFDPFYRIK